MIEKQGRREQLSYLASVVRLHNRSAWRRVLVYASQPHAQTWLGLVCDLPPYRSFPAVNYHKDVDECAGYYSWLSHPNTLIIVQTSYRPSPRRCSRQLIAVRFRCYPGRSYSTTASSRSLALRYPTARAKTRSVNRRTKLCSLANLFSLVTARADNPRIMLCTKASLRALCASVLSVVFCTAAKLSHSILIRSTVSAAVCVVSTS
jgi:hypothetical protein